jgi:hypothetical protein
MEMLKANKFKEEGAKPDAVKAIGEMGPAACDAIPLLKRLLTDDYSSIGVHAAAALLEVEERSHQGRDYLLSVLKSHPETFADRSLAVHAFLDKGVNLDQVKSTLEEFIGKRPANTVLD